MIDLHFAFVGTCSTLSLGWASWLIGERGREGGREGPAAGLLAGWMAGWLLLSTTGATGATEATGVWSLPYLA